VSGEPTTTDATADWAAFWQGVHSRQISVPVCTACGMRNWYPSARCRRCGGATFSWVSLSGEVEVYLSMTAHRDLAGLGEAPYGVALVTPCDQPEIRLLARVDPTDPPEPGTRGRIDVIDGLPAFVRT
jgi:uncharacterized OB-fold protein